MKKGNAKKHNIDMMFLMVLFLIFTFSAVSVLLMAVNSYRAVVNQNASNSSSRIATSYIREIVRQHDAAGSIDITSFDDVNAIKISEDQEGYSLYIYQYDGYLMELEAKDDAGVTPDFGNKILEVSKLDFSWNGSKNLLKVIVEDTEGNEQEVSIGIKSQANNDNNIVETIALEQEKPYEQ